LEKSRHELRVRLLISGVLLACLLGCGEPGPDRSGGSIPTDDSALPTDDTPIAPSQDANSMLSNAAPLSADGAEPQPSAQPPDTDSDGVVDASDACPDTQAGKEVDESGCPVDPDGDGVVGPTDLCPNSPYGEPVDETGCRPRLAVAQEYTLLLTFETGSAKILGDPRGALAAVAALMTQYPETTVVIEGHTDDRGPPKYNLKISKARADAVSKVLITDLGIDAARVSTKGFGKTKPIATNATKEGRERNRRVVAVVMPGKAPTPPAEAPTAADH
jgi:outer membrane protein OmpA-like peptidoglycan-associated protein